MENQPIEQTSGQPIAQSVVQAVEPKSSATVWYVVIAVAVIALGVAYFATRSPVADEAVTDTQATTVQTETPALTDGNTTADISTDLNQTSDNPSALDAEAAASSEAVSSF